MNDLRRTIRRERGRLFDWTLGILTVAAVVGTLQGHRIAAGVDDVSFGTLLALIIVFVGMAWWRFRRA